MASEEEFDDLLRKKLGGLKPPAPPAMDWGAMARVAKTGSSSALPATGSIAAWKIILGAAALSGLLWYGYTVRSVGSSGDGDLATVLPIAFSEHVRISGSPSNPIGAPRMTDDAERISEDRSTYAVPSNELPTRSDVRSRRTTEHAAVLPNASARAVVSITLDPDQTPDMQDGGSNGTVTTPMEAVAMPEMPASLTLAVAARRTSFTSEDAAAQRVDDDARMASASTDRPSRMDGLLPVAVPLTWMPHGQVADPPGKDAFPRFALSPWVSIAHSIHSPGPAEVADQVDGLGGLNEWNGTAGIRVEYAFTPRVALISGLQYANKGRLQGTISTSPDLSTDYEVSGTYLEVPLSIRYEFPHEGKAFYVRSGVLMQFNARAGSDKVVMHDQVLKERTTLALSSSSMGAALDIGAGVRFRLGRGIGLFIEPSYQLALSPVVKNSAFDRLPYNPKVHSVGLGAGLTFLLGSR